ncbi:MAG: aminotransferase class IV [Actinobacteria bacterium]|nr:aminotransferase class IV [Actinomycetota bacterium]
MSEPLVAILGDGVSPPGDRAPTADDLGFTRGDGCFEGCRVRTGGDGVSRVDKVERHLDRFARSAAALEIPFDRAAWVALIDVVLPAWTRPGEASLRLFLTRGRGVNGPASGVATVTSVPPDYDRQRRYGIGVATLSSGTARDSFHGAPWLLGGVKTMSYARNMAAQREAHRRGATVRRRRAIRLDDSKRTSARRRARHGRCALVDRQRPRPGRDRPRGCNGPDAEAAADPRDPTAGGLRVIAPAPG